MAADFVEFEEDDKREARARELENASRLDVHTWSEHPEIEAFVASIYLALFKGRKANIKKKHLKVLLLHLYVSWSEDPARKTAFSRNVNDYQAGSIYNELHISKLTISVADTLIDAGYLEQAIGFYDKRRAFGKLSRIWPTEKLVRLFREARFTPFDVGNHAERLTVVLRDRDPDDEANVELEYEPTDETRRMSDLLARYNSLLARTFIDIPMLETPDIAVDYGDPLGPVLVVSQRDKFVRRIFNRGSFEFGGRFYGGWWQRCPKSLRKAIFINDHPTSEVDFSGLHIILLYAMQGIDYWAEHGSDPYEIAVPEFLENAAQARAVAKAVVLFALNAKSRQEAFGAFRQKAAKGSIEKRLTNEQLGVVLQAIEQKHPDIADFLLSDIGIRLMSFDSKITARILEHFTQKDIAVLPVHDSYIVPSGLEDILLSVMGKAFEDEMGVPLPTKDGLAIKEMSDRIEDLEAVLNTWMPYEGLAWQEEDEAKLLARKNPKRSLRYEYQWNSFQQWREKE